MLPGRMLYAVLPQEGKPIKASGSTGPTVPGVNDGDPLGRRSVPDIYGLAVFRGGTHGMC
jgi:hypothetical protein